MTLADYDDVLAMLDEHNVRYVVTGGVAAVLHGLDRPVADLDLVVDPAPAECDRAMTALLAAGFAATIPLPLSTVTLLTTMDAQSRRVDVNARYSIPFTQLWARAEIIRGLRVISLSDLIGVKRARGRDYDLADVAALTLRAANANTPRRPH